MFNFTSFNIKIQYQAANVKSLLPEYATLSLRQVQRLQSNTT